MVRDLGGYNRVIRIETGDLKRLIAYKRETRYGKQVVAHRQRIWMRNDAERHWHILVDGELVDRLKLREFGIRRYVIFAKSEVLFKRSWLSALRAAAFWGVT